MTNRNDTNEKFSEQELQILRLLEEGLSNAEIGERLFLGTETIRWYNKQLYAKLDVHSRTEAVARARARGLLGGAAPARTPQPDRAMRHSLPLDRTSFVGREREIAEVSQLLQQTRLLTLVGPGGTGKTRLALAVADRVTDQYDAAHFIGLSGASDPEWVTKTIARALAVIETPNARLLDTLQDAVRNRRLLLVLDNFEHVLAATPVVTALLDAAEHLTVLVTSREILHVYGEQQYVVRPLTLPQPDQVGDLAAVQASEAVRLFVQRGQAVQPGLQLGPDNAEAIVEICRRLDGLPLALELAAARLRTFTPQTLLARLSSRLDLLQHGARDLPTRQQTLRSAMDWSYQLLTPGEQTLFARLALFRGGWTLESAEQIAGDETTSVLDDLISLVDKSLAQQQPGPHGMTRFTMLETIREFALEQLAASGDEQALCARHARYFLAYAEQVEPELHRSRQLELLDVLEAEHDNLRQALDWFVEHRAGEEALRLVRALCWFWFFHNHSVEGVRWAEKALAIAGAVSPAIRARAMTVIPRLLYDAGRYAQATAMQAEAIALAREAGDEATAAISFALWSYISAEPANYPQAEHRLLSVLPALNDLNQMPMLAWAYNVLGELARLQGARAQAEDYYAQSMALFDALGNAWGASMARSNAAYVALHGGDDERAETLFRETMPLNLALGRYHNVATSLNGLAGVWLGRGEVERAVTLLGSADRILEDLGLRLHPTDRLDYERTVAQAREELPEDTFRAVWEAGYRLSLDEALAFALRDANA